MNPSSLREPREKTEDTLTEAALRAGLNSDQLYRMRRWLVGQLAAHEYAKLSEGGHKQNQVPLRQVFIDLPVATVPSPDRDRQQVVPFLKRQLRSEPLSLSRFFDRPTEASSKKHTSAKDGEIEEEIRREYIENLAPRSSHFASTLLIGGPGQGKSTVSQLACQLHRVALLRSCKAELSKAEQDLVESFETNTSVSPTEIQPTQLALPNLVLFPLQVALPDFAAWLSAESAGNSRQGIPSFVRFAAFLPSAKQAGITDEMLLAMLKVMPSLIVLDGFDEVGATIDRKKIVEATNLLLRSLSENDGKVKLLVTTRPQGYAEELESVGVPFKKLYLAPLIKEEALAYADKLIAAKIIGADQQKRASEQIYAAALESATVRLLTTPLQVTIMAALVQQIGRAPRERWNLFSRYFSTIYDREIERNTYASGLLLEHRSHIERIHSRVALLLQVEAERQGGASARMTRERLEEVIQEVLSEDEFDQNQQGVLVKLIAEAAENRLVFLVEPEPGRFGFEIRSLQEFMAAWALTSGRDSEVEARLAHVAKAPMFKNVTLFAASRLFSEGSPLRDILADGICAQFDTDAEDVVASTVRSGGLLALDMLEEGVALTQPKRARALMVRSTSVLDLPPGTEHLRLSHAADEATVQSLIDALTNATHNSSAASSASRLSAWMCVLEAARRGKPWANELLERFWTVELPTEKLISALSRNDVSLTTRFCEKIDELNESVDPAILIASSAENEAAETWSGWLILVLGNDQHWRYRNRNGVTLLKNVQGGRKQFAEPTKLPPKGAQWFKWLSIARFEAGPTAATLAEALDAIASTDDISQFELYEWRLSWPLATCLAIAKDPSHLRKLASCLRNGELGEVDIWESAESQWKDSGTLFLNVQGIEKGLPWDLDSLASGLPFAAVPNWKLIEKPKISSGRKNVSGDLKKADALLESPTSALIKKKLANYCLVLWKSLTAKHQTYSALVEKWVSESEFSALALVPRPIYFPSAEWSRLLLAQPRDNFFPWLVNFDEVFESLREDPLNPTLLCLLVHNIIIYSEHFTREGNWDSEKIQKITNNSLTWMDLSLEVRAYIGLLVILTDSDKVADYLIIESIADFSLENNLIWEIFLLSLRVSKAKSARKERLLLSAYGILGRDDPQAPTIIRLLRAQLQKRTSDLDSPITWDRLALPLPYPREPLQGVLSHGIPKIPVKLSRIELKEIFGIDSLEIDFPEVELDRGQWVVIIGPNGVGKTSLLKSLAISLRNTKDPSIWPKGSFGVNWQRIRSNKTVSESSILIRLGSGEEHRTFFRQSHGATINQLPEQTSPRLFPLFAYGCRRGSSLGGSSRKVNLEEDSGPEIATLFDEGADLIQAETWLISLDGDAARNIRSREIFDAVCGGLKELLNVESLYVFEQKVWVTERDGNNVPLNCLSDGFLTQAGWFLDLIARWLLLAEESDFSVDKNFLSQMTGLVLVDELDLHIHPQWQTEIVTRIRKITPRLSFVVTTHNPLTLVGCEAEEIFMLNRADGNTSISSGKSDPILLSSGQIYKQYFGLSDIYPSEIGRKLQRFGYLTGNSGRNNDEESEMNVLSRELDELGLNPGWEITPRSTQ